MLCDLCTVLPAAWLIPRVYEIREGPEIQPQHWWTYPSWSELRESAQTCTLCALIVDESYIDTSGPYLKTDDRQGIRFTMSGFRIEIWCVEENRRVDLHVGFELKDVDRVPEKARKLFDCRPVSKRVGTDGNLRTIKRWIEVCETHDVCNQAVRGKLPTRILDVGTLEAPLLRLHVSAEEIVDYVALSYCWGTGTAYTTTKSNLEDHIAGIDFLELPITLRDAVAVTRKLGYQYLWIDALCIVQDDREDWAREASNMHRIYAQSKLCIAADLAPDTNTTLFADRSARHDRVIAIPWPYDDYTGGPLNLYISPVFGNFKTAMENSHLSKRGWCFQERALSTRILHLSQEMCFWECKEACIGEDDEITKYSVQDGFFNLKDIIFPAKDGRELTKVRMHDKWSWVIEEFTKRKLTVEGDRFAALEGVTTLFAGKEMLGTFLCGLWQDDIFRHLLWFPVRQADSENIHHRPVNYRAPTWSWASVEGPVKNPFIERAFVATSAGLTMMDELGNDGKMGNDNRLTLPMMIIQNINVQRGANTELGSVINASIKTSVILVRIIRGMRINGVVDLLHNPQGGEAVGGAIWDVVDPEWRLWICPVMMCKVMLDGMTASEALVLKAADDTNGESGNFVRVAKARVKNFFFQTEVDMKTITIF